jgi:hypothetical protein
MNYKLLSTMLLAVATQGAVAGGQWESCTDLWRKYSETVAEYLAKYPNSTRIFEWRHSVEHFIKTCEKWLEWLTSAQRNAFLDGVRWRSSARADGVMFYEVNDAIPRDISNDLRIYFRKWAELLWQGF